MKKDLREHEPKKVSKAIGGRDAVPTWKQQEKRVAKFSGGREQPASGAGMFKKGDVDAGDLLIEAKSTDKGSLGLKREWLVKITDEATAVGKTPALAVTFKDMPLGVERDWVLVPKDVLFGVGRSSDAE